ncbi:MAG: ATP-binding protein [Candidatus Omnitrophica bacterium]|nr:ATP-binding protein [Candidatus Omnitrophota bacterium]
MVNRPQYIQHIKTALRRSRATALLGPRQCGKTTLARELVDIDSPNYFDLEDQSSLVALANPKNVLESLKGLVVIDEVQQKPELFPVLRVLLDRKPLPSKFLILGSASHDLLRQSSESLAGRLELIEMGGFDLSEVGRGKASRLWLRGGFPLSFLAENDKDGFAWIKSFIKTFLERDLRKQRIDLPSVTLHRFWSMLANSHSQIWSAAPIASSLGISEPTVRKYLDIFTGVFMVRQLQPWHVNMKKRQVKSPKVYIRDTGILHSLLGLKTEAEVLRHPICGGSWEGFVIEQLIRFLDLDDVYFWATHQGAEIDLVFNRGGRMYGVEIKRADAPVMTSSIRIALDDLGLSRVAVIYPGKKRYSLHKKVEIVPFDEIIKGMDGIFPQKHNN